MGATNLLLWRSCILTFLSHLAALGQQNKKYTVLFDSTSDVFSLISPQDSEFFFCFCPLLKKLGFHIFTNPLPFSLDTLMGH